MRPMALKWRLSILVALALAAAIAAICAIAYHELREFAFSQTDQSLTAMGKALAAVIEDPGLSAEQRAREIQGILAVAQKRRSLCMKVWDDKTGQVYCAAGPAAVGEALSAELRRRSGPPGGRGTWLTLRLAGEDYRAIWMRAKGEQGPTTIAVAQRVRGIYEDLSDLLRDVVWIGAGVVVGVIGLGVLVVIWGLRPIGRTREKLLSVTARNLGQVEIESKGVPRELAPFVESVAKMLGRLDEAMRREKAFVADASHELRTPIALAKSTMQLSLSKPRSAEEYRQSLADAVDDLRRMEHLVEELLTLARLAESDGVPNPEAVDLAQLLASVTESFSARVSQAGGKLACALSPATVRGDRAQLERLFANLLDNALRHGPRGGTIRVAMEQAPAGLLRVCVQDEGGNIPPQALPHLFERFYRADPSRSPSTGGAGLGLAIAREVAIRHGGSIQIASEPAAGTRVTVTLPRPPDAVHGCDSGGP